MNLVGRLTDVLNEAASIVEESQNGKSFGGILNARIDSTGILVQLEDLLFLESFKPNYHDVHEEEHDEFPIELTSELDGVKFLTIFTAAEIIELKETHPDHFDYIQKELQK